MNKIVPIKTTVEVFFLQYLNILSPITRIQGKEAEVLAELMYQNYLKSHIPEEDRFKLKNPYFLWTRKCMKEACENVFETSYNPDRPEIVYCEKCYQQEVN